MEELRELRKLPRSGAFGADHNHLEPVITTSRMTDHHPWNTQAVWLASKVKETLGLSAIKLALKVDAEWPCYADQPDKYTISAGFEKWQDTDLITLID